MSGRDIPANGDDLLYQLLLSEGFEPDAASQLIDAVNELGGSPMRANEVAAYLTKAWNMTPTTLPAADRATYAELILVAMRGKPQLLDNAIRRMGDRQPWLKSIVLGPPEPHSVPLAWAEHFMNARAAAAQSGDEWGGDVAVDVYAQLRERGFFQNANSSPTSAQAVAWGKFGANQGAQDYKDRNLGIPGPPGQTLVVYGYSIVGEMMWKAGEGAAASAAQVQKILINTMVQLLQEASKRIPGVLNSFSSLPLGTAAMMCSQSSTDSSPSAEMNVSGSIVGHGSAASP